ncbi:hypothetical protein DFH09DRAFT_276533 [Mycena vulgaris]|nr:hypothetical protein DFH09DRAFT_276533 [Mycena vulgaris]
MGRPCCRRHYHPLGALGARLRLVWSSRIKNNSSPARTVAWHCIARCQKYDWTDGSRHKERCNLFEVDRKFLDEYIKSRKPSAHGISNPTVRLEEKVSLWARLHSPNIGLITAVAFGNRKELKKEPNRTFFLKLVGDGPEYDHRSFVIDKVALIPWTPRQGWRNIMTGFCVLPEGKMPPSYAQEPYYFFCTPGTLPPGFDLHHYIIHINR